VNQHRYILKKLTFIEKNKQHMSHTRSFIKLEYNIMLKKTIEKCLQTIEKKTEAKAPAGLRYLSNHFSFYICSVMNNG
jgi:hypothetical protein